MNYILKKNMVKNWKKNMVEKEDAVRKLHSLKEHVFKKKVNVTAVQHELETSSPAEEEGKSDSEVNPLYRGDDDDDDATDNDVEEYNQYIKVGEEEDV